VDWPASGLSEVRSQPPEPETLRDLARMRSTRLYGRSAVGSHLVIRIETTALRQAVVVLL
jgi:hypothetical protein